jgi:hypothetical protein
VFYFAREMRRAFFVFRAAGGNSPFQKFRQRRRRANGRRKLGARTHILSKPLILTDG